MKHTHARHWRVMAAAVGAVLFVGILGVNLLAQAFWNESTAVHIKAREIESSTLAIGTHLIHLSALTDSIYEIAEKSAEESGQFQVYYKSELGGNAWFDITTASTLEDITTGGMPVTDEEIEALFFTHHTKSDKVTYNLRTGQPVNIFDIRDPYDLESLEELSPLKMQYDQIRELQGGNDVTKRIDQIWKTPVSGDEGPEAIQTLDRQLASLQSYLNVLTENGADAREMDQVTAVMEAVDASRRYQVFLILEPVVSELLDELGSGEIVLEEDDERNTVELEESDPELISAVSESLGNVQNALITYGGKMLDRGTTVMSAVEYDISNDLISHAEAGNHAACDEDVAHLVALDNILNDVIADRNGELDLLNDRLLPEATDAYTGVLWGGESGEYRAAVAKQSAQVLLNRIIDENTGNADARRGELEFLLQAWCNRMDSQSAIDFLDQRLILATGSFTNGIPQDAFAQGAAESVAAHTEFLAGLKRKLELAMGGNAMDELLAKKETLQEQQMAALDKNDLAKAKELGNQLEALEEEIRAAEEATAAKIEELKEKVASSQGAEKAVAQAELESLQNSLSEGTLSSMVQSLKDTAMKAVRSAGTGNNSTGTGEETGAGTGTGSGDIGSDGIGAIDALVELLPMSSNLVLPALQEIHDALVLAAGDQDLIDQIEQAILDNPGALRDDLTADEIKAVIEGYLEDSGAADPRFSALRGEDALAALTAMQLYYDETGNRAALGTIGSVVQRQLALGNPGVFYKINDSSGKYVPLTAIQSLTGRRYVWEKNSSLGVLARGSDYYGFTVYSRSVLRDRDGTKTETMARMAKYQNVIHIPEEYAYDAFGVQAVYLSGTDCGCICDNSIMEKAQELLALLLAI